MKHPKTTVLGFLTILTALSSAAVSVMHGQTPDWVQVGSAVTTGFGLMAAADGASVNAQQKLNGTYPAPPLTPK